MHAPRCSNRLVPRLLAGALAAALAGCAVGPDFVKPTPAAPDDWTSWRSGDASLRIPTEATQALRTAAPFAGVLSEVERRKFLADWEATP